MGCIPRVAVESRARGDGVQEAVVYKSLKMRTGRGCPLTWMRQVLVARVPYFGGSHVGRVLSPALTTFHPLHQAVIRLGISIYDATSFRNLQHDGVVVTQTCGSPLMSQRSRTRCSASKQALNLYAGNLLGLTSLEVQRCPTNSAGHDYPLLTLPAMTRVVTQMSHIPLTSGESSS